MGSNMMCCARVNHPARASSSIEGNSEIFIVIDLHYTSCRDMRVHCFSRFCAVSLLLLLLFLLLRIPFLFPAFRAFMPVLLAVVALYVAFIALLFDRGNLVQGRGCTGPATFLIENLILDLLRGKVLRL